MFDDRRRFIVAVGLLIACAMSAVPPWRYTLHIGESYNERPAKYRPVFWPPSHLTYQAVEPVSPVRVNDGRLSIFDFLGEVDEKNAQPSVVTRTDTRYAIRIDFSRLALQYLALAFLAGAVFVTVRRDVDAEERPSLHGPGEQSLG